ncbi:MAG: hypothetical protein IKF52_05900 [Clostridia bacterium]|nr:hypothetical protein [Clostridia bacterium]
MEENSQANAAVGRFWKHFQNYFSNDPYIAIKDYNDKINLNSEICSNCGGKCCKKCGCHFSPYDFKEISFEYLKEEIKKGYISIDNIDGDDFFIRGFIYILRARNKNSPIVDTDRYLATFPCILWDEKNGCKLNYEKRPSGGKLLIPVKNGNCYSRYDIEDCAREWLPYQKILKELVEFFVGIDYEFKKEYLTKNMDK